MGSERRGGALHFGRRDGHRRFRLRRLADFERIDVDRLGDVLALGRAEIADRHREPSLDLPIGLLGKADRPGLRDPFEARRDIDAIAHQVAIRFLDDIAEVNPDTKLDAPFGRKAGVSLDEAVLHLDGAAYRIDHTVEFYERSVTGALDDAAVVHRNCGINQVAPQSPEPRKDAIFVSACEPAVPDDVGRVTVWTRAGLIAAQRKAR